MIHRQDLTVFTSLLLLSSYSMKAGTPRLRRGLVGQEESHNTADTHQEHNPLLSLDDTFPSLPPFNDNSESHFNDNCGASPCPDATFCGLDGQCHAYSCDAWYTLGPPFFTNYTKGVSEELTCHDKTNMDRTFRDQSPVCGDDWPVAVEFLTGDNSVSRQCPVEHVPSVPYRRKCTARPTPDTALVCYDMGITATPAATARQAVPDYLEPYLEAIDGRQGRHAYSLSVMAPSLGIILPLGEYNATELNVTVLQSAMDCSLRNSQLEHKRAFPYCDNSGGCRVHEFCGRDKACHSTDCNSLYQYGPVSMVGVQEEDSDSIESGDELQLKCTLHGEEVDIIMGNDTSVPSYEICGDDEWPIALDYKCSPKNIWSGALNGCPPTSKSSKSGGRTLPFARRCVGQPNPDQTFVCYDMKGVSLADFTADYVNLVADNPNCTEENLDSFLGSQAYGDWPMCPQEEPICLTARHEITNRVSGDGYSTNLYWRKMSEDALTNPLNLESLDKALYSKLSGWRRPEPWDSNDRPEPWDPDASSDCGTWRFTSSVMVSMVVCVVANVW